MRSLSMVREAGVVAQHLQLRQASVARPPHRPPADDLRTGSVHWVIAELDAHGQIDGHAAMCLRFAITDAVAVASADIVIDLRDLTAIDADAIAHLRWAHDACRAHALHLDLLIGVRAPNDTLVRALTHAGLATQPVIDHAARLGAPAPPRGRRLRLLRDQPQD